MEGKKNMADKFLNNTGLQYFYNRIKTVFAKQTDLTSLSSRVDDIVAEGGEPNIIETVKVNGTALVPTDKAVDVIVPTQTSQLTNNGDGTSNYATESYVDLNGGKIDVIKVNNVAQTITNKEVNITVPTVISDLSNDSGYQTQSEVQSAISSAIGGITSVDYQVVASLPATGEKGIIYLVSNSGSGTNVYDEYIYVNSAFEFIGTTQADLSNYWSISDLTAITTAEIDTIVDGA